MHLENELCSIEITIDPTYTVSSSGNRQYDLEWNPENLHGDHDHNTAFAIHISFACRVLDIALVGALNSYDTNCAVLDGNVLTIMQDNTISQVSVKDGALLLHKEFECWGCTFGLYHVSKGYVVYGEEEILMLDEDFHKLWGFTSRDIFVSCTRGEAFEVDERSIRVYNWFDDYYELDFSGKVIREILQETDL